MIATTGLNHAEVLEDYLSRFHYQIKIDKRSAGWYEREEKEAIVNWTRDNCGIEYKDWYAWVGGVKDPFVVFAFVTQSRANWFMLRWGEYVVNN
jgi:hypothetical protein